MVEARKEIYVDMDGVLADFVKLFDVKYGKLDDLSKDEQQVFKRRFAEDAFFLELEQMPGAIDLMLYLDAKGYEPTILTGVGKYDPALNADDKKAWLDTNFGSYFNVNKFRWVTRSQDKALFVKGPESIIIDDRECCTDPWTEAGGTSVLYKDFESAKLILDELLK